MLKINKTPKIKKFWIKTLPNLIYISKGKNTVFSKYRHNSTSIVEWNKFFFLIKHQMTVLKKIFFVSKNLLLVTELTRFGKILKTFAAIANAFYAQGPWKGGILSNIYWYKFVPDFALNINMQYAQQYLQEIKILGIPNIFCMDKNTSIKTMKTGSYFLVFPFRNHTITKICYSMTIHILFLVLRLQNNTSQGNMISNAKTILFIKKLRKLKKYKKNELSHKILKVYKHTKYNKSTEMLIIKKKQRLYKYPKIKNLKKLKIIIFLKNKRFTNKKIKYFINTKQLKKISSQWIQQQYTK